MINDYKDKIKVGMVVKNYKEMITILNENYKKNANNRAEQEKEWHRFFSWTRDGNKFIITEVKEVPELEEIKTSKKSKYINHFGYILLRILKANGGHLKIFKNRLYEDMRIKSHPYVIYCKDYTNNIYASIVNTEIGNIFNSCIRQMLKKNLIEFEENFYFIVTSPEDKTELIPLNKEETKLYNQIKQNAYEYYAIDKGLDFERVTPRYIASICDWDAYYKIVNKLCEKHFADDIRSMLDINLINDAIYDANPDTVYDDLNNAICDRIITLAEKQKSEAGQTQLNALAELNRTTYSSYYSVYDEIQPYELYYVDADGVWTEYLEEYNPEYDDDVFPVSIAQTLDELLDAVNL